MGDWSVLNDDLLGEIALRLDAVEDFVYFSTVCRSWNRASSMVKPMWRPSMPYLLLAENTKDNPNSLRTMYSIGNDRCYQLSMPETAGARCWGSDCGWIVTIELDLEIHLFNPLTGARTRLPPQTAFPSKEAPLDDPHEDAVLKRRSLNPKAIVVKLGETDDLIVVAIHGFWKRFVAFARPGDQTWTKIVPPRPLTEQQTPNTIPPFGHRASDIACRDGMIIILYEDASLGYLPISDLSKSTSNMQESVTASEFLATPEPLKKCIKIPLLEMYLVKSLGGDLLVVLRHRDEYCSPGSEVDEDDIYETTGFEVYELDFETKKVEQVKELGDVALFLGDSHSMSLRASDCRSCKANCIYFTDDYADYWELPAKLGGHDAGIFDLKNDEINKFYNGNDDVHSDVCTPFWFMPRF